MFYNLYKHNIIINISLIYLTKNNVIAIIPIENANLYLSEILLSLNELLRSSLFIITISCYNIRIICISCYHY